ncbi:MAG TPA: indole-3-glycerol phosphate synthase TrpC [Gemmatimonadaceae bacterium]|nr:indole-3-glycerol phosphate synthase TrpC [Gemmatimonadaceae bacterium]
MQASTKSWVVPSGLLGRIVDEARERVEALKPLEAELRTSAMAAPPHPPFAAALRRDSLALIAEIKRRSPSKGEINSRITISMQARAYEDGGAAAISVLTEERHFGGAVADVAEARRSTRLPILRKDFIVDPLQIAEARAAGASAVLLIARALAPTELAHLAASAHSYGIETLVEVRSDDELDRALALPGSVIGVNSRDLETLAMDRSVSARLLPLIPSDRIAVAESGIATVADATAFAHMGADALLVGSALSASPDPAALAAELASVARVGRARRD